MIASKALKHSWSRGNLHKFRVEEYNNRRLDQNLVDPYVIRLHKAQAASSWKNDSDSVHTKLGNIIKKASFSTRAEMDTRITKSGKNIAGLKHCTLRTSLHRAKTFLEDEYLHEIETNCDERQCFYCAFLEFNEARFGW